MAHAGGRPTKYNRELHPKLVKLAASKSWIDKEIAEELGISESTFYEWKKNHREFSEALKAGKKMIDQNVENALYRRAVGYEHTEEKIFNNNGKPLVVPTVKHYPPDTAAAFIWLKNRRPKQWRDKQEIEHSGEIKQKTFNVDIDTLSEEEKKELYFKMVNDE